MTSPAIEPLEPRFAPATIVVTGAGDAVAEDGVVTLREAILAANTNQPVGDAPAGSAGSEPDLIYFSIPGSEPHRIAPASPLPVITDPVWISASTATGGEILLDGRAAGARANGLEIAADGCTVSGFYVFGFAGDGIVVRSYKNSVTGNTLGFDFATESYVGNGDNGIRVAGNGNFIHYNSIFGSGGHGILVAGERANGNHLRGNTVGSPLAPTGLSGIEIAGYSNHIEGNPTGTDAVSDSRGDGVVISGNENRIYGVRVGGETGNRGHGIVVTGDRNQIGGYFYSDFQLSKIAGNIITQNDGHGIVVTGDRNIISTNRIGFDPEATDPRAPNGGDGIFVTGSRNEIGRPDSFSGFFDLTNIIAFNAGNGITVAGSAVGVKALDNQIFQNGGLPIDLGDDGPTANDPGDADAGPNGLTNFPLITRAEIFRDHVEIEGTFQAGPRESRTITVSYPIEVQGSDATLRRASVDTGATADADGHGTFLIWAKIAAFGPGAALSAVATDRDPEGGTSEASPFFTATAGLIEPEMLGRRTARFPDVDGDIVTVRVTRGHLRPEDLWIDREGAGGQLRWIKLDDDFRGSDIFITARRRGGGDGQVNVGFVDAGGVKLGAVTVEGDLGGIRAGNTYGVALGRLAVESLGTAEGTRSQDYARYGRLDGDLGSLRVAGDVALSLAIAGGKTGRIVIGGDVTGSIGVAKQIDAVAVGGSLFGGQGDRSGSISGARIGPVFVGGSLVGGPGSHSGSIEAGRGIGPVRIAHDLCGGEGAYSGSIRVTEFGAAQSLHVGGDALGGGGYFSGTAFARGPAALGGSVRGGDGAGSGAIGGERVAIAGDVRRGEGRGSGTVTGGAYWLRSAWIGGALDGGIAAGSIGRVRVEGSASGEIVSSGFDWLGTPKGAAMGIISIGGNAERLMIFADYDPEVASTIGRVEVGGDWIASSVVAGIDPGPDRRLGTADDAIADARSGVARIARIIIDGAVKATEEAGDRFLIVAGRVGAVRVSDNILLPHRAWGPLPVGPEPDTDLFLYQFAPPGGGNRG